MKFKMRFAYVKKEREASYWRARATYWNKNCPSVDYDAQSAALAIQFEKGQGELDDFLEFRSGLYMNQRCLIVLVLIG